MRFCKTWLTLRKMGPKPVVIFELNRVLVEVVPEHKYYFPVMSLLKRKENVMTSWKRGIHLNFELGSWFKLVVFSIYRDRGRSSEKFTEPTPGSTLGSFHDFQKEKVRLKFQSQCQKVYTCIDAFLCFFLIFQLLCSFFSMCSIFLQFIPSLFPRQLCVVARAVKVTRFHFF